MSTHFHSPQDILRHLDGLGLFHMDMSLARMQAALTALKLSRPPFVTVQILGTNGKGSTAAFLASLATAHGCSTGLYTSPHFVSPAERIRVDGRPLPLETWLDEANILMDAAPTLTYFEFLTVLALLLFRRRGVDLAVLEAGLGGRHDATTAVAADVQCFTPMALDHKDVLGESLRQIAEDKAAAVRGGVPLCTARQFPVARDCLAAAARRTHAPLLDAPPLPTPLSESLGLAGPHQQGNAALALTAWQQLAPLLGKTVTDATTQARGLHGAFLPGRLQSVPASSAHPALLLDGAHNPHGMAALVKALQDQNLHPAGAIFSCLGDKDWRPAAFLLRRVLGPVPFWVAQLDNARAAHAPDVAQACSDAFPALSPARPLRHLRAALAEARTGAGSGPVVLSGSLYLLAEFFTLYPQWLTAPQGRNEGTS